MFLFLASSFVDVGCGGDDSGLCFLYVVGIKKRNFIEIVIAVVRIAVMFIRLINYECGYIHFPKRPRFPIIIIAAAQQRICRRHIIIKLGIFLIMKIFILLPFLILDELLYNYAVSFCVTVFWVKLIKCLFLSIK